MLSPNNKNMLYNFTESPQIKLDLLNLKPKLGKVNLIKNKTIINFKAIKN
jgi:hypothetical protein